MAKEKKRSDYHELLVEDRDRNVETEVIFIVNWAAYDGMLSVWSKNPAGGKRVETIYNTANFRSLTVQPMED